MLDIIKKKKEEPKFLFVSYMMCRATATTLYITIPVIASKHMPCMHQPTSSTSCSLFIIIS